MQSMSPDFANEPSHIHIARPRGAALTVSATTDTAAGGHQGDWADGPAELTDGPSAPASY
jgi:hypothetical protein